MTAVARSRRPFVALVALSLLAACGTAAPDMPAPTPSAAPLPPKERLIAAIEENGCELTADNVGTILLRANLTQDQLMGLVPELAAEGAEVAPSGAIRVLTDRCI